MKLTQKDFYALICDDWKYTRRTKGAKRNPMLCGVYSTEREALDCDKEVQECVCDHYIAKVLVTVKCGRLRKVR